MKKVYLILIALLIAGCGNDQYAVERRYWHVQKEASKIYQNPHATPPRELARVVGLMDKLIQKYPQTNLAVDAEFSIARLYIVKEEYEKARQRLQNVMIKYKKLAPICAEAIFLKGNSYELENNWGAALSQYNKIMHEYPLTPKGIEVPVYIAQHYKIKYQPDKMVSALQEAIAYYQHLSAKHPKSPLSLQLEMIVAQCYLELKDYPSAINTFNSMIETYKGKIGNADEILLNVALIYDRNLKDKVKAKETLEKLLKDYPHGKTVKAATEYLKKLK